MIRSQESDVTQVYFVLNLIGILLQNERIACLPGIARNEEYLKTMISSDMSFSIVR